MMRGRRGRFLTLLAFASVGMIASAGGALAANARTTAGAPYCSPSAPHTNPHPNCMFRPSVFPKQAQKFNGTATVVKGPTRVGKTFNYRFTVTVHYSIPYQGKPLCAPSGAPTSAFPCVIQPYDEYGQPNVGFGITGAYIPGLKALAGVNPVADPHQNCPHLDGTCTESFQMNTYSLWGHFVFVVGMSLGYYVPYTWAGNVDGTANFETAISVTFPKLKGSSPVEIKPS